MKFIKNLSIKGKIILVIEITSMFVILIWVLASIITESNMQNRNLDDQMRITAHLIGQYAVPALTFPDSEGADDISKNISEIPLIDVGIILNNSNEIFSEFKKENTNFDSSKLFLFDTLFHHDGHIHISQRILYNGNVYGYIHLIGSKELIKSKINDYILRAVLLTIALFIISFILGILLQKPISKPILALAELSEKITNSKDYSIRAVYDGNDEIQKLYSNYNEMIIRIEENEKLRNQYLKEIEYSEERLRSLLEMNENLIFIHTPEGLCTYINAPFNSKLGKEVIGKNTDEIFDKNRADKLNKRFERIVSSGNSIIEEFSYKESGDEKWISEYSYPIKEDNHKVKSIVTISADITDRKRIELELKKIKERYDLAVSAGNVGVWDWDILTDEIYIDPVIKRMIGYNDNEINNELNEWYTHFHQDDLEILRNKTQEFIQNRITKFDFEHRKFHKSGELLWFNITAVIVLNSNNEPVRLVGTDKDITERKRQEDRIKKLNSELEKRVKIRTSELEIANKALIESKNKAETANKLKSEFIANMSHEIRTPLNSILGFGELLSSEITETLHKRYIQTILTSGSRLLDLLNDVLDLSKIEAGKLDIILKPMNLKSLINEIHQIFIIDSMKKGIDFTTEISDSFPKFIISDESRLRQILLNITGNAVKFTDKGSVKISVSNYDTKEENTGILIEVKDTGIGIKDKEQDAIFQSFKQQDTSISSKYGGTGLGLAISKRLVEKLNGSIELESRYGKGSTFRIKISNVRIINSNILIMQNDDGDLPVQLYRDIKKDLDDLKVKDLDTIDKIIELLDNDILPETGRFRKAFKINDIKDFANKIDESGQVNKIDIFCEIAEQLIDSAENLDLENIDKIIEKLYEIRNDNYMRIRHERK